jgi:DNA processing protein
MTRSGSLTDDERYAAAIASLGAGPRRIRQLLEGCSPREAWEALVNGDHPGDPDGTYRPKATAGLLDASALACDRSGASVLVINRPGYPSSLSGDPEAPAVLFALGDPCVFDSMPRVALVGTRSATPYGAGVASAMGRDLAGAGVVVVSGMAKGIDSAAHEGALCTASSSAIAVLGTSVDGRVPKAQETLRRRVAESGAVVSELPPGSHGAPAWWFALRNRLLAALAHVVVVVESHVQGGAMHTVRYAHARERRVAAVPGSVRSSASAGANALLVGGAAPVRNAQDVIALLEPVIARDPGLSKPSSPGSLPPATSARTHAGRLSPAARCVLAALSQDPAPVDAVMRRCRTTMGETALMLEELEDAGLARNEGGWWSTSR